MQERAKIAATALGIEHFKSSNVYVERFLRRSSVGKLVRLHDRSGLILPSNHVERMTEPRIVT